MPSIKEKCSAQVSDSGGWHTYRCRRNATVVEGGKPYCGIHSPSHLAAKRAKKTAQYEANEARLNQQAREATENRRRLEVLPKLVTACEELDRNMGTPETAGWVKLRATIAEAKGQGEKP